MLRLKVYLANTTAAPQLLFGRGPGGGASLREAASPAFHSSTRRQVAAALSAAVTTTPKQGNAPNLSGRSTPKEKTSLFPATLREGARGEAAALRRAASPGVPFINTQQVAAALSAAADHNLAAKEPRPPSQAALNAKAEVKPTKRQPLFGREREGGASLREAASLAPPLIVP